MQLSSAPSLSSSFLNGYSADEFAEISGKFSEDFNDKLEVNVSDNKTEELLHGEQEEDEEEEEEEEFSFVCMNTDGSPICADEVFHDGQIRPVFPIFNQELLYADYDDGDSKAKDEPSLRPPLRKLFIEERDSTSASSSEPVGPCCAWSGKAVETSPEVCKKSNSTGFSKLRRFRELVLRSNSDGKDAFVFLNPSATNAKASDTKCSKSEKVETKKKVTVKGAKVETASSAHLRHYMKNRALKEEDKRKSYLPYRQDLVGFFTNVNGLSKNVHPF